MNQTDQQKTAAKAWNSGTIGRVVRPREQPARESWWAAHSAPDAPREAFTAHLRRRQAERLISGSDFARSPARPI